MRDSLAEPFPPFGEIAQGMIRGDRSACEAFVDRFTEPLKRTLIARFGFTPGTVDDLTQDTLLEILQKLQSGDLAAPDKRPLVTEWVYTCLERNAIDHLRRKSVRRDHEGAPLEAAGEVRDGNARRPQSILDSREREEMAERIRRCVREEVEKTTGRRREILDLVLAGMRVVDVAKKLNLDPIRCQHYYERTRDKIVAHAQARALGLNVPTSREVTRQALSDAFAKLPKYQFRIAVAACLEDLWMNPEEIARRTRTRLDVVQTNLEDLWDFLSRRFRCDFPEALKLLEPEPKPPGDARK